MITATPLYRGGDSPSVSFRLTKAERAELDDLANRLDMTVSDLIRESLEFRRQQVEAEAAKA
jgi:predicted DNA-binding protein